MNTDLLTELLDDELERIANEAIEKISLIKPLAINQSALIAVLVTKGIVTQDEISTTASLIKPQVAEIFTGHLQPFLDKIKAEDPIGGARLEELVHEKLAKL